ncbi:tetratricopeptide repeat protein [Planktothrix sp. FACHB-1365]|uniref:tetratricopeptide repeat protein n=1 Tax=Planktothrix sp. FACHB-1365 TaxID=2692855 RepID=UPI00168310FA|nr:tetratricopeptide repeat protein [Planktothrix sp. FACHB-1365]MBD2484435.1 tetratricopeptide repeat protein [Planktothrix sp. FACHB-1365]
MAQESLDIIQSQYQAGQLAFEQGRYRESVQYLEQAREAVESNSRLGGEIQIWLVTALEASGQRPEALALCKQLIRHPTVATRQQARRLREVLEAPKLYIDPEGFVKIPDLNHLDEKEDSRSQAYPGTSTQSVSKSPPPVFVSNVEGVKTQDNYFLWVALIMILLVSGGLFWLGSF